ARVGDYGLSRLVTQSRNSLSFGRGTPYYMAPEMLQRRGDHRSDIYSLGVLLYEILVGAPPFEPDRFRDKGLADLQKVIRDEQPPRPSTRFSTLGDARTGLAQSRAAEPDRIARRLRGGLDWIVMKALEKQRTRRYDTAAALAEDVRRFLRNEPVAAGPPTARYRVGKFISRHRAPLVIGTAMLALLLGALAGTSWGLLSAQRERDRAVAAEAEERAQRLALERQQEVTDELMTTSMIWLQNAADQMRRLVEEGVPPSFDEQGLPIGLHDDGPIAAETEAVGKMASVVGEVFLTVGQAFGEAQGARARAEGRLAALAGALDAWAAASVAGDLRARIGAAERLIATAEATLGQDDERAAELAVALTLELDDAPIEWRTRQLQRAIDRLDDESSVRAAAIDALASLRNSNTTGGN
ncbi:MAG: protein kinase, partial [Phycisphaerales bacterium]